MLTKGQLKDLETIKFFIPDNYDGMSFSESKDLENEGYLTELASNHRIRKYYQDSDGKSPEECFFDVSDKGLLEIRCNDLKTLNKYREGKRWRGIHMHELYEPGILDGSMPYWVILGGLYKHEIMPRSAVDFMKKEMFKGIDAEIIERTYQEILWQWTPWYKKLFRWLKLVY